MAVIAACTRARPRADWRLPSQMVFAHLLNSSGKAGRASSDRSWRRCRSRLRSSCLLASCARQRSFSTQRRPQTAQVGLAISASETNSRAGSAHDLSFRYPLEVDGATVSVQLSLSPRPGACAAVFHAQTGPYRGLFAVVAFQRWSAAAAQPSSASLSESHVSATAAPTSVPLLRCSASSA